MRLSGISRKETSSICKSRDPTTFFQVLPICFQSQEYSVYMFPEWINAIVASKFTLKIKSSNLSTILESVNSLSKGIARPAPAERIARRFARHSLRAVEDSQFLAV